MRGLDDLHDYQRTAIDFMRENPKSAAFMDLGLGKTISTLTVLSEVLSDLNSGQALIIAPIRVAKQTWPTEIAEWEHTQWLEHTLIRAEDSDPDVIEVFDRYRQTYLQAASTFGVSPRLRSKWATTFAAPFRDAYKKEKRCRLATTKTPLHIIGLPQVEWLVEFWGKRWPYKTVVIDESSAFKAFDTNRWKAMNKVYPYIDRMHLLTASPAAETWMDLWAQVRLLDRGERLGQRITHYREDYFNYDSYTFRYTLKSNAKEKISEKISDICLVMKAEDHLDRAKPLPLNRYIELPESVMQQYDKFMETFILSVPDAEIEAVNGGVLLNKLLQFTGGAVLDEEKQLHEVHNEKIEDIKELVEELQGSPLMVVYWYNSSLARLKKAFPKAVVMDRSGKCVPKWNNNEIDVLLVQPAGAAHGLNMQYGRGHDIAYFDIPWSRELYDQVAGRIDRQGQKHVVRKHHLIVRRKPNPAWTQRQRDDAMTADEIVMQALEDKGAGQDALFRYIRAIRERLAVKATAAIPVSSDSEDDL